MMNKIDIDACCGCAACVSACPAACIQMIEQSNGFKYPKIEQEKCIECRQCERICPVVAKKENRILSYTMTKAYAAFNLDDSIRKRSSSGGIFSLLAHYVIGQNGYVVGAVLNEDNSVMHEIVKSEEELDRLYGSKYVQSDLKKIYVEIKKLLSENKKVLFSGTPCQVAGLVCFLGESYENLICVDVICHGVPSALSWREYLGERIKQKKSNVVKVNFRDKTSGWKNFGMCLEYENQEKMIIPRRKDSFLGAFLDNVNLRSSCYQCSFKGTKREADITLGDFWGIQNICPQMDDDGGTSLVILNSEKGIALWKMIGNNCMKEEVELEQALKYNTAALESVIKHKNYDEFFEQMNHLSFDKLVKKTTKVGCFEMIKQMIRLKLRR